MTTPSQHALPSTARAAGFASSSTAPSSAPSLAARLSAWSQPLRQALLVCSAALLVACGGGGGGVVTPPGDGAPPDVADPGAPAAPTGLSLAAPNIKTLNFQWNAVEGATHYKLLEDLDGAGTASSPTEVTASIAGTQFGHEVPLYARLNASYTVKACNALGCSANSAPYALQAADLNAAIGYAKASSGGSVYEYYGFAIALSKDGNTLAVGEPYEDTGASNSGAVYVMRRTAAGVWTSLPVLKDNDPEADEYFGSSLALSADGSVLAVGVPRGLTGGGAGTETGLVRMFVFDGVSQFVYENILLASTAENGDRFGAAVALSDDGNVVAVGAPFEDSAALLGVFNDDNSDQPSSGAVFVYRRTDDPESWDFQHALKASNAGSNDYFGVSIALSGNGLTLAVGASGEDSTATGVLTNILNPAFTNDDASGAGAVYVFSRPSADQNFGSQVYIKASNSGANDNFGQSVALSQNGSVLAVGAYGEASSATGINGNGALDDASYAGAAYVFVRNNATGAWTQQAFIKASNTTANSRFGYALALSSDGNTLAVGAYYEFQTGVGLGADPQEGPGAFARGAVYVYKRSAGVWSQSAYVKPPSQTTSDSSFGASLALSGDGGVLAVGNSGEDHQAPAAEYPIVGAPASDNGSRTDSGAVYIF